MGLWEREPLLPLLQQEGDHEERPQPRRAERVGEAGDGEARGLL